MNLRERVRPIPILVISGLLTIPGTSSAELTHIWTDANLPESTSSGSGFYAVPRGLQDHTGEATKQAVSELRRISGLTWDQLSNLFGVSRRSIHFWASGKPLNATNEERLMRVLDVVRYADQGDARSNRTALLALVDGSTPFDLLAAQQFEEARASLGNGRGRDRAPRVELSATSRAMRQPLLPEDLVEANHEPIHKELGQGRAARTVRNKPHGRG